jgi:hypothetical protein
VSTGTELPDKEEIDDPSHAPGQVNRVIERDIGARGEAGGAEDVTGVVHGRLDSVAFSTSRSTTAAQSHLREHAGIDRRERVEGERDHEEKLVTPTPARHPVRPR